MPYLPTGLAGYSVDPGISRGARKLAQTPWVIQWPHAVSLCFFFKKKETADIAAF